MRKTNRWIGRIVSFIFTLCLCSAKAAIFDAGLALKADMSQGTPANPYADADGGVWTFGKTTRPAGGTVTTLDKPDQYWGDTIKGFSDPSALPTINVNTGDVAVTCANGLSDGSHTIAPGEIVLHPADGPTGSRFAIIRFVVPQTGVYDVSATFRDVAAGGGYSLSTGVDVHVVINGKELSRAVVAGDPGPPAGALPSFTADLRSLSLAADDTVDFVIGPNGTDVSAYGADGTAVRATVTLQPPHLSDLINLDINGYDPGDGVPGTGRTYSGAAVVGSAGDFWNSAAIRDSAFSELAAPQLKLADGITRSTVRFSMSKVGGLLHGDCRVWDGANLNPLLDDYVYILPGDVPNSNAFTISGLVPNATYTLYFYCHAGTDATPGRFTIKGLVYDSVNTWVISGDYAECPGITADGNGVIAGDFSRATSGAAVVNGLQIVGTFPLSQAEVVSLDINGYNPTEDPTPGAGDAYFGTARVGGYEDFWNTVPAADTAAGITASCLKLASGITHNTTVSFSMSKVGGGSLRANRSGALNALLTDYVFIPTDSTDVSTFTIAGLVPYATYDLFFYGNEAGVYAPGRFVISGVTYDSIDMTFPASGGGDTAVCAGITADGSGAIAGEFSRARPEYPAALNGLQIVGAFPLQHADIVNIDINGFGASSTYEAGAGDAYTGAAAVGAAGDHWNCAAVKDATVASIAVPNLKLADGITNTTACFSLSAASGGLLGGDRMAPGNRINPLLDDCVYIYDHTTPTNRFTLSGLIPDATYDLLFYCNGGPTIYPGRFIINGMVYDSIDFSANVGGDYALFAGITADASGSITGDFCRARQDRAATFDGLQIVGTFPQQHADIVNLDINGYMPPESVSGGAYSGAARVGAAGDYWNSMAVADYTVASVTAPHLKCTDGLNRSTVTFGMSVGEGTLGADHIYEYPLNPLLDDYVYFYGETISFTISGLVPGAAYDLYFYCHAGTQYNPVRVAINGMGYYSYDTHFAGGDRGDYAVCAGIIADSSGSITGDFSKATPSQPMAGVINGLQIMGDIPRLPRGTIIKLH